MHLSPTSKLGYLSFKEFREGFPFVISCWDRGRDLKDLHLTRFRYFAAKIFENNVIS